VLSEERALVLQRVLSPEFYSSPYKFAMWAYGWGEGDLKPFKGPRRWQKDFMEDIEGYLMEGLSLKKTLGLVGDYYRHAVASGRGPGKAQPVGLTIDTPTGRKRWGGIKAGDFVFGRDGKPTKVIAVWPQGKKKVYRVTLDDESSTECCGEHLWRVHHGKLGWLTMSLDEMIEFGVKGGKNTGGRIRKFRLPTIDPVEYKFQWVPIEPYMLGIWLGDGSCYTGRITSMDQEVWDRIASVGYKIGDDISGRNNRSKATNRTVFGLKRDIVEIGLNKCSAREKHVPDVYKYNIREIREEVLKGLIDSDGYVAKDGYVVFSSCSERLVEDVMWLTRSLGGRARRHKIKKYNNHQCTVTFPDGFVPGYIRRKVDRIRPLTQKRYIERFIDRVEYIGEEECQCITVEADDSLYLSNDFIPTHNSALVGMLSHWFISTRIGSSTWVAANGKPQLESKTFPEIAKWVMRGINSQFFEINSTTIRPAKWFADYIESPEGLNKSTKYYYIAGQLWSEENPDAFAGAHNFDGELAIFDEGSGIPDEIWGVQEGVFTEDIIDRFWLVFSNPRRNSGKFFDCFRDDKWRSTQINSMDVEGINKETFRNIIEDCEKNGNMDRAKIEVYGQFPSMGDNQFIATHLVREAQTRDIVFDENAPLLVGVDIARGSNDWCVARFRQGRDARSIPPMRWQARDFNESARKIADLMGRYSPDAVFIDQGMGSAVVDILKDWGYRTTEVAFGGPSSRPEYAFKRTDMAAEYRDWLRTGGIDKCPRLFEESTAVEIKNYGPAGDKLILEPKDLLKKRIGRSPDDFDALILTFAQKVPRRDATHARSRYMPTQAPKYNPHTRRPYG